MNYTVLKKGLRLLIILMAVLLMAAPSFAATFNLRAEAVTVTLANPDGTLGSPIPMWGFACDSAVGGTCSSIGVVTVPGPMLTVSPGETTLTINLTNNLPTIPGVTTSVSIVIPGLPATLSPVFTPDAQGRQRATSFTAVAAANGGMQSYTWNNLKSGTYLYQSGTHPQVQVQMGLYGGVKIDVAANTAYPSVDGKPAVTYDNEVVLFYSEIDSALHDAVAGGTYGTPPYTSTLDYKPDYFLINGQPFQASQLPLPAGSAGQKTLIRFVNAGLKSHAPTLLGSYLKLIAEDGNLYPYPPEQYSLLLAAGKTIDALWTPTCGDTYKLYDHYLNLTTGGNPGGGMLAYLQVGGTPCSAPTPPPNQAPTITSTAVTTATVGVLYTYDVNATDPDAGDTLTFSLDVAPTGMTIDSGSGLIQWTPQANQTGSKAVTVRVTDLGGLFATQSFSINVTGNPPTITSAVVTTATVGVLYTYDVNATDLDTPYGEILTYSLTAFPTGMTINSSTGLIQWTPSSTGNYPVTVRVTDLAGLSATQSFTITVSAMLIHIGDLDGSSANIGSNRWRAFVRATVHNGSHALVSGATVTGTWSAGDTNGRVTSCTTDVTGQCGLQSGRLNRNNNLNVTFTVTGVAKAGATYQSGSNHDPDVDSNGTSITVSRP